MRPRFRNLCLAALTLTACSAPPEPREVQVRGLKNGIEYGDLLFAGQPDQAALATLEMSGYRTVVNTRGAGELIWNEAEVVKGLGMAYHEIPMGKPLTAIDPQWVTTLDEILRTAERPILLHCGSGNRVSGLYGVWLVEHDGMTPEMALERAASVGMTSVRPLVEKALGVPPTTEQ